MKYVFSGLLLTIVLSWASPVAAAPVSYAVDPAESVFAVITHKAGVASRLAHNHLIAPRTYSCEIGNAQDSIKSLNFTMSFPVKELAADLPESQKKWYPAVKALAILDTPFSEIDESDRTTIEEHMLAEGQLDAEQFPEIKVELVSIESAQSIHGEKTFNHAATIRFTVHGKTVERAMPANIELTEDTLRVEAIGQFRFTEFGIEPYSAFLGAVKNKDEFDVYVHIQAKADVDSAPADQ
ncbi:MAG: hypothetical protein AMXMBFR82_40430 [Candidatus Hydrogenedentota bacterium]